MALIGWVGASEAPSADRKCARLAHPGRRPPPFPAVAVDQGPDQLAVGGDIRKRREVDSQRQSLATLPARCLIGEQDFEPVDREDVGMRRQKREDVRGRNAVFP